MNRNDPHDATRTLLDATRGDRNAAERFVPLLYENLRRLAARYLQRERPDHTLQPTALVNEAYLGLIKIDQVDWSGKTHFFAMAARQMRRVLIDHARRRRMPRRITLDENLAAVEGPSVELLALDRAIERLSESYPRQGQVAELRLFAGMKITEIAHFLNVSRRTATEDWALARAWLARVLRSEVRHE